MVRGTSTMAAEKIFSATTQIIAKKRDMAQKQCERRRWLALVCAGRHWLTQRRCESKRLPEPEPTLIVMPEASDRKRRDVIILMRRDLKDLGLVLGSDQFAEFSAKIRHRIR